jgi:hypothetical protein
MADDKAKKKPKIDGGDKPSSGGKIPSLDVGLGRGLRLLILWSLVPLGLIVWCVVGWKEGPVMRGGPANLAVSATWFTLGGIIGGAGLAACAQWLFWPVADWIRRLTVGGFAKGNKLLWFIPLIAATPVWVACYAVAGLAAICGAIVTWRGLDTLGLMTLIKGLT